MKKLSLFSSLLLILSFVVPTALSAQTEGKANGPQISVDKDLHNYGKIKQNADGTSTFTITNTGTEPLIISKAEGSCGCTVPDWPREAINPGKSATMKVTYDTKRLGVFNKSVTITSNSVKDSPKVVSITGEVLAPATEEGAPAKN